MSAAEDARIVAELEAHAAGYKLVDLDGRALDWDGAIARHPVMAAKTDAEIVAAARLARYLR